jgi:hypothetical protein
MSTSDQSANQILSMIPMRHQIFTTLTVLAGLAAALATTAPAQDLDSVLFTVGTTLEDSDSDGHAWSYLLWQAEDLEQLKHRSYAIYSKPGEPDSPDPYAYEGVARTRLDPLAIQALVNRGIELGDDPARLESDIDTLFEQLIPDGSISLAGKISAVVESCLLDGELFENLIFLSRTHPTLSLVLGTGFASRHPEGQTRTWEVRECPPDAADADACTKVVARVTLKVGNVQPLPAPGRPVHVPFNDGAGNPDPRAHLNVPIRWSTPDALRERALLQFGYNIYRMGAVEAEADGFHVNPPDPELLAALAADPGHSAMRVNNVPVLIDRMLDAAEATDTVADPRTYFHIDDNGRHLPGGVPFQNGDAYYYFITARDILGRDGEVSDGTHVLVCDFQPPPQPSGVQVTNHYTFDSDTGVNTQHFKVEWTAPDVSGAQTPETITGYHVYRWWSIDEMHQRDSFPLDGATAVSGGLVAVLPHTVTEFIDNGADAPYLSVERLPGGDTHVEQGFANKTFWYTVRAVDGSACGGNLSGNSAPAYGVLRDRIGPPRTDGSLLINCLDIRVIAPNEVQEGRPWVEDPEFGMAYLTLEGFRKDPHVEWVEFAIFNPQTGATELLEPRHPFASAESLYTLRVVLPQPTADNPLYLSCRMGGAGGKVSSWNILPVPFSSNEFSAFLFHWVGESIPQRGAPGQGCDVHEPYTPSGELSPVEIVFGLTESTEEWKVYRRINDGNMTLMAQGLDSAADVLNVVVSDANLPAKDARVCYFVQLFDQHGNPSPVVRIGCVEIQGKEELPTPMLLSPTSLGDESSPKAQLGWFCPPYGIEYFEVQVAVDSGNRPTALGPDFQSPGTDISSGGRTWRPFLTRRVPTTFTPGTPEFSSVVDGVALGETYTFRVRAIGDSGSASPFSNEAQFTWNPDSDGTVSGPNVPWPALGLPGVTPLFHEGVLARFADGTPFDGGAVRIGELNYENTEIVNSQENPSDFFYPPGVLDPNQSVFRNAAGDSLMPFVIYRYQVPNPPFYPAVSGDVYQVTPMMEEIASMVEVIPGLGGAHHNHDPFILIAESATRKDRFWYDLLVKDTQPLISGARYRYLIVRFDPVSREIIEIIPTNSITAP